MAMKVKSKVPFYQSGVFVPAGSIGEVQYASKIPAYTKPVLYVKFTGVKQNEVGPGGKIPTTYAEADILVAIGDDSVAQAELDAIERVN